MKVKFTLFIESQVKYAKDKPCSRIAYTDFIMFENSFCLDIILGSISSVFQQL